MPRFWHLVILVPPLFFSFLLILILKPMPSPIHQSLAIFPIFPFPLSPFGFTLVDPQFLLFQVKLFLFIPAISFVKHR